MKNSRLRILSIFIIVYMTLALVWWAILLDKKNTEAFKSQSALFQYEQVRLLSDKAPPIETTPYIEGLTAKYNRQRCMIYGEALVFGLSLILGIWFINRAFSKELEINKRQNNFLLSITHELKSPLSSILLSFETIKNRMLSKEQQNTLSENGISEVKRLESMVNKLLLSAKLEADYSYNFEEIDLDILIKQIINNYNISYPNHVINHNIEGNQMIRADKEAMISVIQNLIENAIKYSDNTSAINVTSRRKFKIHELIVQDHGIGIAPEESIKIFDRFYRVGSEETRKTNGTGMGLFIVNEIVKAHGATIDLQAKIGKGSTFIIKFPLQ